MKIQTKSKKVNKTWLNDHVNDPYVKRSQKEGYRSRAVYKLQEIDELWGLIKPGCTVVDLGSAPGAWSQYARRKLAPAGAATGSLDGRIISLDLLPMETIEGVHFIQGNFTEESVLETLREALEGQAVDVVISDMAPNLSGHATTDAARIEGLVELAIEFASAHLHPRGALIAKAFHGGAYDTLIRRFREVFKDVRAYKPKASRDRSAETFLLGRYLKE